MADEEVQTETEERLANAGLEGDAPGITDNLIDEPEPDDSGEGAETQAAAEAGAEPTDSPNREPVRPAWIDSLGDDFKGLSEQQAQAKLTQYRQQAQQAETFRRQAFELAEKQRFAQYHAQEQERQRQLAAQAEAAKTQQAEAQKKKWALPPWNPELEKGLETDEKGNLIVKPGYDPNLAQQYVARKAAEREIVQKLISSPDEFIAEFAGDKIQQLVQQGLQTQLQAFQQQNQAQQQFQKLDSFERQNAALFYHDPQTMQQPTEIGLEALRRQQAYRKAGIQDPAIAAEYALRDMYAEAKALQYDQLAAQPAPAAVQAKVAAAKHAFQKSATPAGGVKRETNRKPAAPEAKPFQSSRQLLEKNFAAAGYKTREDSAV